MNRAQRRALAPMKRGIELRLANGGMPDFLDTLFGPGTWSYDAREHLWIVPDKKYKGPGHAYYCVRANGDWFKARVPEGHTQ
ncbi:MAG: hypothetical protein KGK17_06095 [Betaproteobacteria bacterium]|nr:hypothetical protein [Betaproteobacteria bacterium]